MLNKLQQRKETSQVIFIFHKSDFILSRRLQYTWAGLYMLLGRFIMLVNLPVVRIDGRVFIDVQDMDLLIKKTARLLMIIVNIF